MSRILVVVAHPDDEILGCGGTILRKIAEGDDVYSLVLGEGITSRYDKRELVEKEKLEALHSSHTKVSKFMGFREHWLYDFPDNRFDSVDLLDIVKVIEKIKEKVQPEVIYTHFENDLNIDHRITFQAVLTACRPVTGESTKEIYSCEIPSSTEWVSPFSGGNYFRPNVFIDIQETIGKKIEAMRLYDSEVKQYPHPRSPEALKIISQRWAIVCGLKYAEAFILIRKIDSFPKVL
jgi:LmbE family N-acetylglucosaminyl deacetylase